jgi:hypothetical protein
MADIDPQLYDNVDDMLFGPERKRLEARRRDDTERLVLDMKTVLSTAGGRRILFWLLERGGLMRADYNGRSMDLAYETGRKSLAGEITSLAMVADPKIFARFIEDRLTQTKETDNG